MPGGLGLIIRRGWGAEKRATHREILRSAIEGKFSSDPSPDHPKITHTLCLLIEHLLLVNVDPAPLLSSLETSENVV